MVEVQDTGLLSDIREQTSSRRFPDEALEAIASAVRAVPRRLFEESTSGREIRKFDGYIAAELPGYEYEHSGDGGRNPACKLWKGDGFDHSVDLYNADRRIAIEIEKSERKRVSDDILKFIKGGKTRKDNRAKIEFGCLIVPTNYRGTGDLFKGTMTTLNFMRSILFVEDIAVIGYRDPRWEA